MAAILTNLMRDEVLIRHYATSEAPQTGDGGEDTASISRLDL